MKTTNKKTAVKKETTKIEEPKKVVVKSESKPSVKSPVSSKSLFVSVELSKIGAAYTAAINGKMKFSEVKEMFKKLHREVKKSSKK